MQCKQVREHLSAYLDRELTAELATAVRHHLASCPECRAMLEELRATADLLGRLPAQQAPEGLADDVMREVERRMLAPQAAGEAPMQERTLAVRRARPWPRVLAVAACVALAAGIGLVAFFGAHPFEQPAAPGPETLARHEALDAAGRLKLGSEAEARTSALPKRRSVAAGESLREALALGDDWFFLGETGGKAAGDGLDLRLSREETPTTDLYALGTEPGLPDTDLYAWTDRLGRTAARTGSGRGEEADKTGAWAIEEADEPPPGHFYYDFNGLPRQAPYGPVAGAARNGDADGDAVALDDGGVHLAFGVRAKDAAGRAAPAEVLLGEKRGRQAAGLGGVEVVLLERGAAESADEKAPAVADLRVARRGVEPEPAPPVTDAAAVTREHAGTLAAKAAPTTEPDVTESMPDEMAKAAEHRMVKAGPATTPKAAAVGAVTEDQALPAEPADPQLVQMAMNTVAVGQAPVASLRRLATVDNLDLASNQLVVRAPSRKAANRELVHLFDRNGWRELDERANADLARKKAPAEHPALTGFATARGGQAGGLYYLAHHNGEDLWVVLTTADDLSRFATQVAQSRTMQVGADSSRPFRAVRYLQQQLASFEAEAYARRSAGGAGAAMADKAAVRGGAAAGKMAGGTVSRYWGNGRVAVPAKEAPRKGDVPAEVGAEET
ncbi:MAG: zf-HC2 domain-containing protein, partial [Planctomycetota bacterium]|nr:zf-HC2 domain-containing protein [Planctomycetota bacterium]